MHRRLFATVWCLLLCMVLSGCPLEPPPDYGQSVNDGTAVSAVEQRVFDLINHERANHGVPALVMRSDLCGVARGHSQEMAEYNYLNHENIAGMSAADRLTNAGIAWRTCGENIAYNSGYADPAARAVVSWMESPGHRQNILNEAFTHTGVGVAQGASGTYFFTQVFAGF